LNLDRAAAEYYGNGSFFRVKHQGSLNAIALAQCVDNQFFWRSPVPARFNGIYPRSPAVSQCGGETGAAHFLPDLKWIDGSLPMTVPRQALAVCFGL